MELWNRGKDTTIFFLSFLGFLEHKIGIYSLLQTPLLFTFLSPKSPSIPPPSWWHHWQHERWSGSLQAPNLVTTTVTILTDENIMCSEDENGFAGLTLCNCFMHKLLNSASQMKLVAQHTRTWASRWVDINKKSVLVFKVGPRKHSSCLQLIKEDENVWIVLKSKSYRLSLIVISMRLRILTWTLHTGTGEFSSTLFQSPSKGAFGL